MAQSPFIIFLCFGFIHKHRKFVLLIYTFTIMSKEITKQQQIRGWVVFDWANSAYNLVIVSTVFPGIFKYFLKDGVEFMGIYFKSPDALYTYALCFSYLIISIMTPILSGIADFGGYKKRYMQFFSTIGSLACISLYFFDKVLRNC